MRPLHTPEQEKAGAAGAAKQEKGKQMKKPYLLLFLMIALALFALACGERNAIPEKDVQKHMPAVQTEPPAETEKPSEPSESPFIVPPSYEFGDIFPSNMGEDGGEHLFDEWCIFRSEEDFTDAYVHAMEDRAPFSEFFTMRRGDHYYVSANVPDGAALEHMEFRYSLIRFVYVDENDAKKRYYFEWEMDFDPGMLERSLNEYCFGFERMEEFYLPKRWLHEPQMDALNAFLIEDGQVFFASVPKELGLEGLRSFMRRVKVDLPKPEIDSVAKLTFYSLEACLKAIAEDRDKPRSLLYGLGGIYAPKGEAGRIKSITINREAVVLNFTDSDYGYWRMLREAEPSAEMLLEEAKRYMNMYPDPQHSFHTRDSLHQVGDIMVVVSLVPSWHDYKYAEMYFISEGRAFSATDVNVKLDESGEPDAERVKRLCEAEFIKAR